ncbi:transposase family protein [Dactylosporangium sp. NPDC000521]|uniref:transposase family protein n=1 Tax=Dactylosporangium sp. NPDC000521 TaxID=3363975 RepID=UPI0036A99EB5
MPPSPRCAPGMSADITALITTSASRAAAAGLSAPTAPSAVIAIHRCLVLRKAPHLRREHSSRHAPGRTADPDLAGDVGAPARLHLCPTPGHHRRRVWAASTLDLKTLADSGYDGAGQGIHAPYEQPGDGRPLAADNRAHNLLLRSMRRLGERGFAILTGRWRTLRHTTANPRALGDIVAAALHLAPRPSRLRRP